MELPSLPQSEPPGHPRNAGLPSEPRTPYPLPCLQPLDLHATLFSGQTFRWRHEAGWYHGVVFGNVVKIREADGGIDFTSAPDEERVIAPLLRDYLSPNTDLETVYVSISRDARISESIQRYRGMRILRQDPWECLISFLCAQASNIPRITKNVNDICATFGRSIVVDGHSWHAFPTPDELAGAGEQSLRDLRLGYRARYIAAAARTVAEGHLDLMAQREDPYEAALEALLALDGVGDKVANCILLFSLDKPQAFPVDVWIHRALQDWYLDPLDMKLSLPKMRLWAQDYFGPYAGYANQYLFHDRRLRGRSRR